MKHLRFTFLLVLCIFFSIAYQEASATSYVPSTQMCWYAFNISGSYPCPPTSTNPTGVIGGTPGMYAYAFEDGIGINIHLAETEYNNASELLANLQYLNMHHIRDGLGILPGSSYARSTLNSLGAAGIKSDLIVGNGMSASTINSDVLLLNSGDVDTIEGTNELDINHDSNWGPDDVTEAQNIRTYITTYSPTTKAIGPSIGGFASYATIGDISSYIDEGNTHDYQGGFPPDGNGWGGPGYCGLNYATPAYNLCNAKQASVSKPVAATEFGYDVNSTTTNFVDDGAQATYLIRQILVHYAIGIPISYIYSLYDSSGQNYGLLSSVSNPRIGFSEFAGFMNILKDSTPVGSSCTVPAYVATSGIRSQGVCLSDGRYALVIWQPVTGWDTNAHAYATITPINAVISYSPGFGPSSVTQWSYPLNGQWSNSGPINHNSVPTTDRPSIVMFNGSASPAPLPTMPP